MEKVTVGPGCWVWQGTCDDDGYGMFWLDGRMHRAHRVSFSLFVRELDAGEIVRHTCDNPPCVRPAHLIPGTHADNVADCIRRNRRAVLRGEQNPAHKLTDEEVLDIRALGGTMLQREIGDLFGVTQAHVSQLLRGVQR